VAFAYNDYGQDTALVVLIVTLIGLIAYARGRRAVR
jgi:hypothetical protein